MKLLRQGLSHMTFQCPPHPLLVLVCMGQLLEDPTQKHLNKEKERTIPSLVSCEARRRASHSLPL